MVTNIKRRFAKHFGKYIRVLIKKILIVLDKNKILVMSVNFEQKTQILKNVCIPFDTTEKIYIFLTRIEGQKWQIFQEKISVHYGQSNPADVSDKNRKQQLVFKENAISMIQRK
jgi:hypothetical protein